MQQKFFYSVEEVLQLVPFSRTGLYEILANGDIASAKHGRRRFIHAQSLHDYVAQMESPKARKRTEVTHGC